MHMRLSALPRPTYPEASEGSCMGWKDEPLEGFECRMDIQRVTEGVWAWSQPFWVPDKGGKVAVLLIDTEGSMDIESNKETSIKLSALSMLLSSYQGCAAGSGILNIGSRVKDTDLEYLEMLAAMSPCKHPKTLETLSRSSTRCYLMPFPGKGIMNGNVGRLRDMDEDFQERLRGYLTALVGSVGQHIWTDQHGEPLTRTQLTAKIKNLSDVMKKCRFGFPSPCQMAITFHNQRAMDRARMDHAAFLREKNDRQMTVVKQFVEQCRLLLERCQEKMKEPEKETLLSELEAELTREAVTFLEAYGRRYQSHTINQRAMDRARTDHAAFLRKMDALSQRRIDCLRVTPSKMEEQFRELHKSLLKRCRAELMAPEETLLAELVAELSREAETFLETYGVRYQSHYNRQKTAYDSSRRAHSGSQKNGFTNPILVVVFGVVVLAALVFLR